MTSRRFEAARLALRKPLVGRVSAGRDRCRCLDVDAATVSVVGRCGDRNLYIDSGVGRNEVERSDNGASLGVSVGWRHSDEDAEVGHATDGEFDRLRLRSGVSGGAGGDYVAGLIVNRHSEVAADWARPRPVVGHVERIREASSGPLHHAERDGERGGAAVAQRRSGRGC